MNGDSQREQNAEECLFLPPRLHKYKDDFSRNALSRVKTKNSPSAHRRIHTFRFHAGFGERKPCSSSGIGPGT